MSYNSTESAEGIVGQSISQVLLDVAYSIIHGYTDYRWTTTTITETFSGNGDNAWLKLRANIISVTSFVIHALSQTAPPDYEIRKTEGAIRCYSGLPWGHDNIVITYVYGWTTTYNFYNETLPLVKLAEVQIALYLKKNPLMLKSASISGVGLNYQDASIMQYLAVVPRMPNFTCMGPGSLVAAQEPL